MRVVTDATVSHSPLFVDSGEFSCIAVAGIAGTADDAPSASSGCPDDELTPSELFGPLEAVPGVSHAPVTEPSFDDAIVPANCFG